MMGLLLLLAGLLAVAGGFGAYAYGEFYPDVRTIDRTAATVAVVGGMVLIGLGALVSPLRRIATALEAQNAISARRAHEAQTASPGPDSVAARREPRPKHEPRSDAPPVAPAANAIGAAAVAAALSDLGRDIPSKAPEPRVSAEPEPSRPAPEVSIDAAPVARPDEDILTGAMQGSLAGVVPEPVAAPAPDLTAAPRDLAPTPVLDPEMRAPEVVKPAQPELPPQVEPVPLPAEIKVEPKLAPVDNKVEHASAVAAGDEVSAAPRPAFTLQVLKSGVIEGMAYTLYADGSVDAEVKGETRHFSSIAEWRSHLRSSG